MNNISDKNVIIIIFLTVLFVFALIFSIKSTERKVIDSPIIWKEDYTNSPLITYENKENFSNIYKY